jgi:hypothetical protein
MLNTFRIINQLKCNIHNPIGNTLKNIQAPPPNVVLLQIKRNVDYNPQCNSITNKRNGKCYRVKDVLQNAKYGNLCDEKILTKLNTIIAKKHYYRN